MGWIVRLRASVARGVSWGGLRPRAAKAVWVVGCVVAIVGGAGSRALAVPSFARQTGMKCTVCHTNFFQLTPFGRWFKLNGYVYGEASELPPVAAMLQGAPGYTITGHDQPGGAAPHFGGNNNWSVNQISGFYAGRIMGPYAKYLFGDQVADVVNHIGTFAQGTWDGVAQGKPSWDNVEVRYADSTEIAGQKVEAGVYANNSPTMSDLFNSTPVWGYPFSGSNLAPSPAAAPLIAGGVAFIYAWAFVFYRLFLKTRPLTEGEIVDGTKAEFAAQVNILFYLMIFNSLIRTHILPIPILRLVYIALGAKMGKDSYTAGIFLDPPLTIIGANCIIGHDAVLYAHAIEGTRFSLSAIRMGDRVTVGAHAVVMSGVTIGDDAIISAGAVVTKDTKIGAGEIWGGVPARLLKTAY